MRTVYFLQNLNQLFLAVEFCQRQFAVFFRFLLYFWNISTAPDCEQFLKFFQGSFKEKQSWESSVMQGVLTSCMCRVVSDANCFVFLKIPWWKKRGFFTGGKKKKDKDKDSSSEKKQPAEEGASARPPHGVMNPTCLPALKLAAVNMLSQAILPIFHSLFILQNSRDKRQNNCNLNDERSKPPRVYSICFTNTCDTYAHWEVHIVTANKMIAVSLFMLVARVSIFVSFEDAKHALNTSFSSFPPCLRSQCTMEDRKQTWWARIVRATMPKQAKFNGLRACRRQNSSILNMFYSILLKFGRVNTQTRPNSMT